MPTYGCVAVITLRIQRNWFLSDGFGMQLAPPQSIPTFWTPSALALACVQVCTFSSLSCKLFKEKEWNSSKKWCRNYLTNWGDISAFFVVGIINTTSATTTFTTTVSTFINTSANTLITITTAATTTTVLLQLLPPLQALLYQLLIYYKNHIVATTVFLYSLQLYLFILFQVEGLQNKTYMLGCAVCFLSFEWRPPAVPPQSRSGLCCCALRLHCQYSLSEGNKTEIMPVLLW